MFSNFNSAAKITTFQLQHGFTKIKPKQSKQNPSKLILKRNSFSQTGLELLNYSWPAASHPRVMRVSKFSLAGKPYLHNNKYQKWLLFSVLDAHTPPLQQLSQPAEKISIRIEITGKIHMLRLPRLVDLPHPKYQNGWFFQGKLLWTWKVDKHCNLFLFYCNIRYPKSSYQSRTVTQNHLHSWKHRSTTRSSSNSCTSLVGKNGSVRILLSLDLPGPSPNPYKQQARQPCWHTALLLHCKGCSQTRSCRWGAGLGTPHLAEAIRAHSPMGPIWFCSQNLQIHLHLPPFLSLPCDQARQ